MSDLMQISCFHSSSSGNLYRIATEDGALLIECGMSMARIKRVLNFKLHEIQGCLVSHAHADHSKAAGELMRQGTDCYMSIETAEALNLSGHRLHIIEPLKQFSIGAWKILPFDTQHDCPGSLGFLIAAGTEKVLFATDTFYVKYRFPMLTHVMVECNWDKRTLDPNIEPAVKKRLFKSHFSLANVKKFLAANDLSSVQEIHLLHLSADNSNAELFRREIQKITGKLVYVAPA